MYLYKRISVLPHFDLTSYFPGWLVFIFYDENSGQRIPINYLCFSKSLNMFVGEDEPLENELLTAWFDLVNKKNGLVRDEVDLVYRYVE